MKEKILHEAIGLFGEYSAKEVTYERIAGCIGTQKSSIYYYYKTKDALIDTVISYSAQQLILSFPSKEDISAELADGVSAKQIILRYAVYQNEFEKQHMLLRVLYRLSFHINNTQSLADAIFLNYGSKVYNLLKDLNTLGAIPDGDLETLSTLWAYVTFVYSLFISHGYKCYNQYYNTMSFLTAIALKGVFPIKTGHIETIPPKDNGMKEPGSTRELIAHHALQLFCTEGYMKTTTRQIAAKTGIQVGAIYKHYKNKREIMMEVLSALQSIPNQMKQQFDGLVKEICVSKDITLLIQTLASCYLPIQGRDTKDYYILLLVDQYRDERTRDHYYDALIKDCRSVESALDELVTMGVIPPCPSGPIAQAYVLNHCGLCIKYALLNRDITHSENFRIKAAALLLSAIMEGVS